MGSAAATVGGAVATAGTSVAAGVTFGQVPALNQAVVDSAEYTARNAQNTTVRHVGECVGSLTATAGCAVAAGVTLGQVEGINQAVTACGKNYARSSMAVVTTSAEGLNPLNLVNDLSKVAFFEFTRDLPDKDIRCWLARSARDCYDDEPTYGNDGFLSLFSAVHAVVYKHRGQKCFAIRGTAAPLTFVQDFLMVLSEKALESVVAWATKLAIEAEADYITGHSLGGFLAEAVASRLGKDGASFNGPGGRGLHTCFGSRWSTRTRFEVHLNDWDVVSMHHCDRHIAEPKWHSFTAGHSINAMVRSVVA